MKKWVKVLVVILVVLVLTFFVWTKIDSQAIPKTADSLRSVIGDQNMVKLESVVYTVLNKSDEYRFNLKHKDDGKVLASMPKLPQKKPLNDYILTSAKGDLDGIVDVVKINHEKSRLKLVCGTRDPAKGDGSIPASDLNQTILAFSGDFQYKHDFCSIIIDGKALKPMKNKAGTLIVYQDGSIKVGKWGRDWKKVTPIMVYARQNMLLIDQGKFNSTAPYHVYAVGGNIRVFRSAVGVTKSGDLVYAAGNKLSAKKLAKVMIDQGVVNAIHLDMNYGNATCGIVTHKLVNKKVKIGIKSLTKRFPSPQRFLGENYRDFFYVTKFKPKEVI